MDLEVLGTHQLPLIVFWDGWLFKNLSFAQKPPARAALMTFFCAREGSWTQAEANKLVFHHVGFGFLCFPPWSGQPGLPTATNVSTSNIHLQTQGLSKTKLLILSTNLWKLLHPLHPTCFSFGCFPSRSTWKGFCRVLWGFTGYLLQPRPHEAAQEWVKDAADVEGVSTDLTAAAHQSGCALRGAAREGKDAGKTGNSCYFCHRKGC